MDNHSHHTCGCLNPKLSRRSLLTAAGASAFAVKAGLFDVASSVLAAEAKPRRKPVVRVVFIRPKNQAEYWMSWPGNSYNAEAQQADYTKRLSGIAAELGIQLDVDPQPLENPSTVDAALARTAKSPPDGIMLIAMHLSYWAHANRFLEKRGDIPAIMFSMMGTSFTGHLQKARKIPKTYIAATHELDRLKYGMRMFKTMHDMKNTRICIITGDKTTDKKLETIGTTLHYIPLKRWPEEFKKTKVTDEARAIAAYYTKEAKKIVEPKPADILNAAKSYVVARRIMEAENCQAISMNCLDLIRHKRVPCGPCLAWSKLNDEGSAAACEADWCAAISLRLNGLLFGRPGFMQDPAPNTVDNTLMGAHCSCGTKLAGFDKPHEPFILRSHSEPDSGCATQVLWRPGQEVTVWEFDNSPSRIILGTGRVATNLDTPPCGGCRTSVILEMDNVADSLDIKGFHQLFVYGKLDLQLKAYCRLAGIEVSPIA